MSDTFTCPVCGYNGLFEEPRTEAGGGSYEICYSCGFEFGVTDDDEGFTYERWRQRWVDLGMPWTSAPLRSPPADWDPARQLTKLLASGD